MLKFIQFCVVSLIVCLKPAMGFLPAPESLIEKASVKGIPLLGSVELRKRQREELTQYQEQLKKRTDESQQKVNTSLQRITSDLTEAKQQLKQVPEQESELIDKKIVIYHDRRQNLTEYQELWRVIAGIVQTHIALIDEILEFYQKHQRSLKPAYNWKELRDVHNQVAEATGHIEADKAKRENLKKQKAATLENLSTLEKQLETKTKEKQKLVSQLQSSTQPVQDSATIKDIGDNLDQELLSLQEKIDRANLVLEKIELEIKYKDDVVELEYNRLDNYKKLLSKIESRLVINASDVEAAKNEWRDEVQRSVTIKEKLNKLREPKKLAFEQHNAQREELHKKLDDLKKAEGKASVNYLLTRAKLKNLSALCQSINKEVQLLDIKKELADTVASEKELQFSTVEFHYKIKTESENIDIILSAFSNKRDVALGILKALKDKRTDLITDLINANQAIERIKKFQNKIRNRKVDALRSSNGFSNTIIDLSEQTKELLIEQIASTQAILAVNADIITHQEKIVSQYDLIIKELIPLQRIHNIWKRSPRAISPEGLARAALEMESFLKELYWKIPVVLNPLTMLYAARSLHGKDFLLLLLFILFYLLGLYVFRRGFRASNAKLEQLLEDSKEQPRSLYLHLLHAFIDFATEHCVLLFTWLFIFVHVAAHFSSIFIALRPLANRYSVAVFYLVSIPILVYLSRCFVHTLKELNRQLSFFLFAEAFQDKFILLVTMFCYATSVLLPLRASILTYTQALYSELAAVILAAYSLILLLEITFLFTKEDVLNLIPSPNAFFVWLKRKIDHYYYPVFLFIIALFILSNPYIGFSNMAWFLAFAAPASLALLYVLFLLHFYVRKYSMFIFMREEDDEIIDKFEHAKTYYGFFVIFSFLILVFFTTVFMMRIWGFDKTPADLWRLLSEQWVIRVGVDNKLGLVEFMLFGLCISASFVISSLMHKFVLSRLYEILRPEPGAQNTISRIVHYTFVFFSIVLGLYVIHLEQFIFWVSASFSIGVGFALKDIVADMVAGFFVLIERPIEIGSFVQIDNVQGTVHKIAARSTTIITSKNHSIIIPNKDLVSKWITNWGQGRFAVGFEITIRVDQKEDPEKVKRLLLTVIQSHPLILKVPAVVVRLEEFDDNALCFLTRAFISSRRVREQWEIASFLRTEIMKTFKKTVLNSTSRP